MLRFPYLAEPLKGPPPPSLAPTASERLRPLAAVRIIGPAGQSRFFPRAVLDSGADDTVFPLDVARFIGVSLVSSGHQIRWRGQHYPLHFGSVELELQDDTGAARRWPGMVAFSPAPLRYPILGQAGCLQFYDSLFRGHDHVVELQTNPIYPGTC